MKLRARKVNNYDIFANHAWYVPGVGGMFALLGWFLVGALLGSLIQALFALFVPAEILLKYSMIVVYPVQFLPPMMYAARKSRMNSLFEKGYKLNSANFGPYPAWVMAVITVFMALGTMISADLPNYWNFKFTTSIPFLKQMYDWVSAALETMTGGPFWSSFLVTAIFAPIFEEWLCRGMVLRGLLIKMKPAWAIVISALFFALIHMNPWQALNAFIIGVVMGYLYYKTGSLILTMLIHFVNNGLAVVMTQIPSMAEYDFWIDMMGTGLYSVVYVLGLAALAGSIYLVSRIPLGQERGNIDEVTLEVE